MTAIDLLSLLDQAPKTEDLCLILRWPAELYLDELRVLPDVETRVSRRNAFYAEAKQPLLDALTNETGIRVTNALEGTSQAVLVASPEIWKKLLTRDDLAELWEGLTFTTNGLVIAVNADVKIG